MDRKRASISISSRRGFSKWTPAPAPTPPSPGLTEPAGDSFHWISAGESVTYTASAAGSVTLVNFADAFHWSSTPDTTPAPDTHTAVVDTTVHDTVAPILPDPHILAATVPSIGGYIVH